MAKRGQNEGSIYKRKDGRWVASLNLGFQGGKRKRKCFYGWTRREVQEKLTEALRNLQQGLPLANDVITVEQFLDKWLEDSARPNVRSLTYESYERIIRNHIKPELGRIKLAKLAPHHIQSLINKKLEEGASPRYVQYIHAVLRGALGQAYKWGMIHRNVAKLVDPPRVRRAEVIPLTPEQARAFLETAKGDRLEALYCVALALGLRRGEALGLKWEDINFETGTLRVNHSLQWPKGGGWVLVEPKTARSRRNIRLPQVTLTALIKHRKRQVKERLLVGDRWEDFGFVFTTGKGTPLMGWNVAKRSFKPLLKKAGLPDIRFHDLRHTAASLLLAQGVQPRVIMETLGHCSISLTMDVYSHVMPIMQKEAAEKMQEILSGN